MYASCPCCGSRLTTWSRYVDGREIAGCSNPDCKTYHCLTGSGDTLAEAELAFMTACVDLKETAAWDRARIMQ